MCGITGLWAPSSAADSRARVEAMNTAIAHRGPDGAGLWSHEDVHFGHRRLSIVDLSPTGAQPMHSASKRYTITFNGEVYNYKAIRAELEKLGRAPAWRGSSDTEVMLAAIEAFGLADAVGRFVGMFAFALWDSVERQLHLVRDRL